MNRYSLCVICLIGILVFASPVYALSGYITSEVTWSGTIDLDGDIVITATGELTVLPGTMVTAELSDAAFSSAEGTAGKVDIIVHGTLNAVGNSGNMITFTSTREGAGAQRGDWSQIRFWPQSIGEIYWSNIRYSGGSSSNYGIFVQGAVVTVESSVVSSCAGGICSITSGLVYITNCTISNSGINTGIRGNGSIFYIIGNLIENNSEGIWTNSGNTTYIKGNTIQNNNIEGICIGSLDTISTIEGNIVINNGLSGITADRTPITVTGNTIEGNTSVGLWLAGPGNYLINLGNIQTTGPGGNTIRNNGPGGAKDIDNDYPITNIITAEGNWWGTTESSTIASHIDNTTSGGSVDYIPFVGMTIGDVASLEAIPGNARVALSWDNPPDPAPPNHYYYKTLILRKAGSPISGTPQAGRWYSAGQTVGDATVIFWSSAESHTDTTVTNGVTYYYKVFASDGANYSTGVSTSALPESQGPDIAVYSDGLRLRDGDYISARPALTATLSDVNNVIISSLKLTIDSGAAITSDALSPSPSTDAQTVNISYQPASDFSAGNHTLKIEARDLANNWATWEATLKVSATTGVSGAVLNYPNPFKPAHGIGTKIGYMLTGTGPAEVTIYIFDTNGHLVWKRTYTQNPGYQEVDFNGISDFGEYLGNGIYLCQIVSGGKVLGKGKMAVLE